MNQASAWRWIVIGSLALLLLGCLPGKLDTTKGNRDTNTQPDTSQPDTSGPTDTQIDTPEPDLPEEVVIEQGTEGGDCLSDDSCKNGLVCALKKCYKLADIDKDDDGAVDKKFGGFDCKDDDKSINPGVKEICGNNVDENCDGSITAGCVENDLDGDGVNDSDEKTKCVSNANALYLSEFHPGAREGCCPVEHKSLSLDDARKICDKNCDGTINFCNDQDSDSDGFNKDVDCDDTDPTRYPGAPEKCDDGIDQDCNKQDLRCPTIVDRDGDGFDAVDDCDDKNSAVHPFAEEKCDGIDNNCNGLIDEGNPETDDGKKCPSNLPVDRNGDPIGSCQFGVTICSHTPKSNPDPGICLGAVEVCN